MEQILYIFSIIEKNPEILKNYEYKHISNLLNQLIIIKYTIYHLIINIHTNKNKINKKNINFKYLFEINILNKIIKKFSNEIKNKEIDINFNKLILKILILFLFLICLLLVIIFIYKCVYLIKLENY